MLENWNKFLLKTTLLVGLLIIFPSYSVLCQSGTVTSASITGTVTDKSGAVIVGATIDIRNLQTNLTRTTQVNDRGFYYLTQLTPGEYEISATANGFSKVQEKLILSLGTTALVELSLPIDGLGKDLVIDVIESNLVNIGKTESSTNIGNKTITNSPINQRNFLEFSLTAARVTKDSIPSQSATASSGLSINGQNARTNNLTIDGLNNTDFGNGTFLATFSQEAIQEFQVITDNFSAEIGRALAGTVNIITKSGGNNWHSNLFFFNRDDEISARNAFSESNPNFQQYQFGSTLSGPIKKNKAFFFSSFERLSIKQNNIVTISDQTVKSIRNQDFLINNGPIPFSITSSSLLLRGDFTLSTNDTLWLRYNSLSSYNGASESFGGLISDTTGGQTRSNIDSIALNNTYFNSNNNLVNETRFIFIPSTILSQPIGSQPQVNLITQDGAIQFGQAPILPQQTKSRSYQFVNNVSINYKNHNLKFGVDTLYFYTLSPTSFSQLIKGGYTFGPIDFSAATGIANLPNFTALENFDPNLRTPAQKAFLNFLSTNPNNIFPDFPRGLPLADLPLPLIFGQGFGDTTISIKTLLLSGFLQDEIKVKNNLLVKLGLRYDINRSTTIAKNKGNFSPRIAFSYNPIKFSKLYLRGGYGLFFGTTLFGISAFVQSYQRGLKPLVLAFPFSILPLQLTEKSFPISTELPQGVNFIKQLGIFGQIDSKFQTNYSQQANLALSYSLTNNTLISTEYSFVRGLKLPAIRNINPVVRPIPNNPIQSLITGRVDPGQGIVFNIESAYDSYYHAFTLSINQRLQNRVGLLASYTYSKSIDNANDINLRFLEMSSSLKPGDERGLSLQDIRNRIVFSSIFDIGYSKNFFLKDLQLSSIVTLESGRPYNLLAGVDLDLSGDTTPTDRPTNLGRNVGILPGFANVDLRLNKSIKIQEKYNFQAIFEVFNLFNRVNISNINRIFPPDRQGNFSLPEQENGRFLATPNRFRGAFAPRQLQIGLKFSF